MDQLPNARKIELRDLKSALRSKYSDSEDIEVVKFTSESLLPLGENYGSTILKVHAIIKRKGEDEEENLDLVAKMMPPTDFQRIAFDVDTSFEKEAFLYEQLIPSYQKLEREMGIPEDQVFDIVAELYGVRRSLLPDSKIDDDAVILMENLIAAGYYNVDRKIGFDLEHGKMAAEALSRFHALGIATKQHKPELFETFKTRAKCIKFAIDFNAAEGLNEMYLQILSDDSEIAPHIEEIRSAVGVDYIEQLNATPPEPWSTIIHNDFWTNNIMFRKDESTGQVSDIKFVDFQNYLFLSPLRELVFFLVLNLDENTMEENFRELIDLYYNNFVSVLKKMKCDVEAFNRDAFDERLKVDAFSVFLHCMYMIMPTTCDQSDVPEVMKGFQEILEAGADPDNVTEKMKNVTMPPLSPLYFKKIRRIVKKYVEYGWFHCNDC
ncbi:hypothetical protein QAD02_004416 [Eretmocerus hayati]|uniref:Uncharacterized protein n=1 Tax=Eretmocerus hayati TaxID=131215 RepID=A0ACC2NPZ2_9HYME|nr:hypothetical protein QAD02_004416 [Eretmocerus hayati]